MTLEILAGTMHPMTSELRNANLSGGKILNLKDLQLTLSENIVQEMGIKDEEDLSKINQGFLLESLFKGCTVSGSLVLHGIYMPNLMDTKLMESS